MTHRITLDVPANGIQFGIPFVSSDEANSTVTISTDGASRSFWSGIQLDHTPEPGTTGTATLSVHKQSNDDLVAQVVTSGTIYLYYPNDTEYGNANLNSNQGTCDWDTYYYMNVTPNSPITRRENIAIRKLTTTTTLNS